MITITKKQLEKILKKKIKSNQKVLGLDTASKTGWCKIIVNEKEAIIDYGFINIDTQDQYYKYYFFIETFKKIITSDLNKIIIEDTFYKFNPKMFRLISRIGAMAYTIAHLQKVNAYYLLASSARKNLDIKGNCKKEEVAEYLRNMFNLKINNDDIGDAIVLALNAL